MNAPLDMTALLPDIQSRADDRRLVIDAVGIKGVRYPITVRSGDALVSTVATLSMTVGLSADSKGTHMSRFIELLETVTAPLDQEGFEALLIAMLDRLDAHTGTISMRFPWFVRKSAPVSGAQSLLDHEVCWEASRSGAERVAFRMRVTVPATSLCPCSKEISNYGAHNQRTLISIDAELIGPMTIGELIAIAESAASCEVYGLLKRPDEKYVTERAYDNPRFVEDLVREVALALNREPSVGAWLIEAENFESIHNHSAFARIARRANAGSTSAQSNESSSDTQGLFS